jgi:uncharacterized protein YxjI
MVWRELGGEEGVRRYRMRQKLVLSGDDYWIENDQGSRVYFVDGRAFRLREHLGFQDTQGNELAVIQERIMRIKDTYRIYRKGNVLATVKKVLVSPLHQRFSRPRSRWDEHGGRGHYCRS